MATSTTILPSTTPVTGACGSFQPVLDARGCGYPWLVREVGGDLVGEAVYLDGVDTFAPTRFRTLEGAHKWARFESGEPMCIEGALSW